MTIELENMQFYAFHGHYREEQLVGNRFRVDLSLDVDGERAAESDELEDAVNYVEVYECVRREMEIPSRLLEHVANRIGMALKSNFTSVLAIRLKVSKLTPPLGGQVERVSVNIEL